MEMCIWVLFVDFYETWICEADLGYSWCIQCVHLRGQDERKKEHGSKCAPIIDTSGSESVRKMMCLQQPSLECEYAREQCMYSLHTYMQIVLRRVTHPRSRSKVRNELSIQE